MSTRTGRARDRSSTMGSCLHHGHGPGPRGRDRQDRAHHGRLPRLPARRAPRVPRLTTPLKTRNPGRLPTVLPAPTLRPPTTPPLTPAITRGRPRPSRPSTRRPPRSAMKPTQRDTRRCHSLPTRSSSPGSRAPSPRRIPRRSMLRRAKQTTDLARPRQGTGCWTPGDRRSGRRWPRRTTGSRGRPRPTRRTGQKAARVAWQTRPRARLARVGPRQVRPRQVRPVPVLAAPARSGASPPPTAGRPSPRRRLRILRLPRRPRRSPDPPLSHRRRITRPHQPSRGRPLRPDRTTRRRVRGPLTQAEVRRRVRPACRPGPRRPLAEPPPGWPDTRVRSLAPFRSGQLTASASAAPLPAARSGARHS